jgi:hypothetical protein
MFVSLTITPIRLSMSTSPTDALHLEVAILPSRHAICTVLDACRGGGLGGDQ